MNLRSRLSAKALDHLDLIDAQPTVWDTACVIAWRCMDADLQEAEFVELIESSPFVEVFDDDQRANRRSARLAQCWAWSEDHYQPRPADPEGLRAALADLHDRITRHRFTGRTATTDRRTALWIVEHCHGIGARSPMLAQRFVAEQVGIGADTARRALGRLVRLGLLSPDQQGITGGRAGTPSRYRLNLHWQAPEGSPAPTPIYGQNRPSKSIAGKDTTWPTMTITPAHPAFLAGALGPSAGRLFWEFPGSEPLSVSELATALGMDRSTAGRAVRRLVDHGVFVEAGSTARRGRPAATYVPSDTVDLDAIAAEYGTDDWTDRTAERFERDRAGAVEFQRQREEYRQRRRAAMPVAGPETAADGRAWWPDPFDQDAPEPARPYAIPDPFDAAPLDAAG
jgi:predicted transcriptional regulator